MEQIEFFKVERHPLNNSYMCYSDVLCIPPYFGTKLKCEKAKEHANNKANKEFALLSESQKNEVLERFNSLN